MHKLNGIIAAYQDCPRQKQGKEVAGKLTKASTMPSSLDSGVASRKRAAYCQKNKNTTKLHS